MVVSDWHWAMNNGVVAGVSLSYNGSPFPSLPIQSQRACLLHISPGCDVHNTLLQVQHSPNCVLFSFEKPRKYPTFNISILNDLSSDHAKAADRDQPATNQRATLRSNHESTPEFHIWQPANIQHYHHLSLLCPQHHPMPIQRLDMRLRHLRSRGHIPHHCQLSLLCPCLELLIDFPGRRFNRVLLPR